MSGPVTSLSRNVARELKDATEDASGWDWFKNQFVPAAVADTFRPEDEVLVELARYAETDIGRRVIEWLHDLTDRAPYPAVTAGNLEFAALGAAKHEGRAGVGHVLTKAIREGKRLRDTKINGG